MYICYMNKIENIIIPEEIKILNDIFIKNNKQLFIVGGFLRDFLLGVESKDVDVTTDSLPEETIEFLKPHFKLDFVGIHFGIVIVFINNVQIEIASFRSDENNTEDRNCDVKLGATLKDDLFRRDLTINSLAYNINTKEIIDLVGGIDDLNNKIIRTVGDPFDRFKEDNLRKLRAVRFKNRLGFSFDDKTFNAIFDDPSLNVDNERIINELKRTFDSAIDIQILINDLIDTALIDVILSDINLTEPKAFQVTSFTTLIASFISWDEMRHERSIEKLEKRLFQKKLPSKVINGVLFLLKFSDPRNIDIIEFMHKRKSTDLTTDEIVNFHGEEHRKFCDFKIPDGLAESFMRLGIKGKDLGDKIKEHCNNIIV